MATKYNLSKDVDAKSCIQNIVYCLCLGFAENQKTQINAGDGRIAKKAMLNNKVTLVIPETAGKAGQSLVLAIKL